MPYNHKIIRNLIFQAHPFGQSFLSAALRIGSLAVRRAVFRALRCGGRSGGGLHGSGWGSGGAVAGALLRQSRDVAKALSEMFLSPRALCRKAERIALDFCSIRLHYHR